jgi:hypothetical protein
MDSKRNQEDLYNITDYTDDELYEILDLTKNPSDRELEAKVLFFIHKYSNMNTKSSKKLAKFFDDIYNHFFENDESDDESDIVEGFSAGGMSYDEAKSAGNVELATMLNTKFIMGNKNDPKSAAVQQDANGNIINPTKQYVQQEQQVAQSSAVSPVTFTKTLDYATGKLNPLIQQTIKRVVSIDSKYRENKQEISTDFTFNLSETLKDVVSLKLYSIQVPYTWYTVNSFFGGNFFYLKGHTAGIDNDYHDMIIDISAGNYDQLGLTNAISAAINSKKKVYSDVSFGNSNLYVNPSTSITQTSFYLNKSYDENSYYIDFADCGVSSDSSGVQVSLGYTNQINYLNTLISQQFNTAADPGFYQTGRYNIIDNCNNVIHIVKYIGPEEWVDISTNIPSRIDVSFDLKIFDPTDPNVITYTGKSASRQNITDELNRVIKVTSFFSSESGIKDPSYNSDTNNNNIDHHESPGCYQFKIKPNRLTTNDILYSKVIIKFPYEDPEAHNNIWTGDLTTCFGFYNRDGSYWNEVNNILSESPVVADKGSFVVSGNNSNYISLTCFEPGFDNSKNSINLYISGSSIYGYSLNEYIKEINTAISSNAYRVSDGSLIEQGVVSNSQAFKDNLGYFNLYLDVEQSFNETTYEIDFRTSIINKYLNLNRTNTTFYRVINGNVVVTGNTIVLNNDVGNSIYIANTPKGNNINVVTGLLGNITTNGNVSITSANIRLNGNLLTTDYIATTINYGNIITKNNSNTKISGSTSMNLIDQSITFDNSIYNRGTTVVSDNVIINGNIINGNIMLTSGTIYSNGDMNINGNTSIVTTASGNNFTITGDVYADGIINIVNNTTITPLTGNNKITSSSIITSGVINTTSDINFSFSNNNILTNILADAYSLTNITDGTVYVNGTLKILQGGISILFPDGFFTTNNTISFNETDRSQANISEIYLNSGSIVITGSSIINMTSNMALTNGNLNIRSANINYVTDGVTGSYFGNLSIQTINTINITLNSLPTFTITSNNSSIEIYGNNIVNYTTLINTDTVVVSGNIYNSGNSVAYNSSDINQYGNIITGNNISLNGNTYISGSIKTPTINILTGNIYNNNSISSTDSLQILLTSGYLKKTAGNVVLSGSTVISRSHISGNFITNAILTNNGNIITNYDVSINGISSVIDASNITINGSNVIKGTIINGNNKLTVIGNITNTGNITSLPLTRINILSGIIDVSGTAVIKGNTVTIENTPDIYYFPDLTQTYINSSIANTSYIINNGDSIAIVNTKRLTGYGNDNDTYYNIIWTNPTTAYTNVYDFIDGINGILSNYIDPMTGLYLFAGIKLTAVGNADKKTASLTLTIKINKRLISKNYKIQFVSNPLSIATFNNVFNISSNMNSQFMLNSTVYDSSWGVAINTLNSDGTATIKGFLPIKISNNAIIFNNSNNKFYLRAYENGVYSKNKENDITLSIPITYSNGVIIKYSVDTLIYTIGQVIDGLTGIVNTVGTKLSTINVVKNGILYQYAKFRFSLKRTYKTKDFKLVFYDNTSFVKCFPGATSVQNITWDTTLGWLLGYHDAISYNLSDYSADSNGLVNIYGDSVVILNLYNYFMISLDDYNSSQINDGLVTITSNDNNNPLPSYTNRSNYQCDPVTGNLIYNTNASVDYSKLTQNQIYALTEVAKSNAINNSPDNKAYGYTPSVRNVFAIIPIKPGTNGQTFVEYGGTLQNQDRNYFGPVNISRMSVKLISDRGDVLNLNGANWSFSLICEQLSNLKTANDK